MTTLITPSQVIEIAFAGTEPLENSCIDQSVIVAAEQKFIRPVIGGLYDKLLEGSYPDLLALYIKAPLALYVKLLSLPMLSFRIGNMGVGQHNSDDFVASSPAQQTILSSNIRSVALTLIKRAVAHIESNPTLYPEYESSNNILNKISLEGNIVL